MPASVNKNQLTRVLTQQLQKKIYSPRESMPI